MRRFLVVFLAISAAALTACSPGEGDSSTVERVGPVNVHVYCGDSKDEGIGARINPWRVHTKGATELRFMIHPTPGGSAVSTTLEPVDPTRWPFQEGSYSTPARTETITAQLLAGAANGTYRYKLTLVCSPTVTIVIDPEVIVDDAD